MIDKRECVFRFAKEVKSTLAFSENKIARFLLGSGFYGILRICIEKQ